MQVSDNPICGELNRLRTLVTVGAGAQGLGNYSGHCAARAGRPDLRQTAKRLEGWRHDACYPRGEAACEKAARPHI